MPPSALLGATGGTGSAVLRHLLETNPDGVQVKIFVRSRPKFLSMFPALQTARPHDITIYSGPLSNQDLLMDCLRNCEIVYNCIATNDLSGKQDLARSSAAALIAALQRLQADQGPTFRPPSILFNRTIGLNRDIADPVPPFVHGFLVWALDWALDDLRAACQLYEDAAAAEDAAPLLRYIFIDPPKLVDPEGTRRTGYQLVRGGRVAPALYYADLGAAFVDVAARRAEFHGGAVGVSATGRVDQSAWEIVGAVKLLLRGILFRLVGV